MRKQYNSMITPGRDQNTSRDRNQPTGSTPVDKMLFMSSNSIIAKISFALLAVIVSIILFRVGINIIAWIHSTPEEPYLVNGLLSGQSALTIPQNASMRNGVQILRSNDESTGMEFTWSIWINIYDLPTDIGKCLHVFNKGNLRDIDKLTRTEMTHGTTHISLMDSPGLYITRSPVADISGKERERLGSQAELLVLMSASDNSITTIPINNIPLRKWINVVIRLQNTVLDVYINGTISKRSIFTKNVPQQSFGDVHVCQKGGFNGSISDLRYMNKALSIFSIQTMVAKGPNMVASNQERNSGKAGATNFFLDSSWYTQRF